MNANKTWIMKAARWIPSLVLMISLAFFPACSKNKNYVITGQWVVLVTIGERARAGVFTFTGSTTSGTVTDGTYAGTYVVSGDEVSFSFNVVDVEDGRINSAYAGNFTSENIMTGTITITYLDHDNEKVEGEWTCNR